MFGFTERLILFKAFSDNVDANDSYATGIYVQQRQLKHQENNF
jgi:hypothetical protein